MLRHFLCFLVTQKVEAVWSKWVVEHKISFKKEQQIVTSITKNNIAASNPNSDFKISICKNPDKFAESFLSLL